MPMVQKIAEAIETEEMSRCESNMLLAVLTELESRGTINNNARLGLERSYGRTLDAETYPDRPFILRRRNDALCRTVENGQSGQFALVGR